MRREREMCCARIGRAMPAFATRKGERCESRASAFHDVEIRGETVTLPLCHVHLKMMLATPDPAALAHSWVS